MLEASPKISPKNRTTKKKAWRVKVKEKEELSALAIQGGMVVQRPIAAMSPLSMRWKTCLCQIQPLFNSYLLSCNRGMLSKRFVRGSLKAEKKKIEGS
jgi:hypothetical protein